MKIILKERAFAYWDSADPGYESLSKRGSAVVPAGEGPSHRGESGWYIDAGFYEIRVGRSSIDTPHSLPIEIKEEVGPLPS